MNKIKSILYQNAFYPLLIGAVFVLNVVRTSVADFSDIAIWEFALIIVIFSIFSHFLSKKAIQNTHKAALLAGIFIVINLYFYTIFTFFIQIPILSALPKPMFVFFGFVGVFCLLLVYFIKKTSRDFTITSAYLNFICTAFVLIELVKLIGNIPYTIALFEQKFAPKNGLLAAADKPNIYYIILDSYTNSASLKQYWAFDNTPFEDSLRSLGFFVATHSKSDYDYTPYCMASYLNASTLELSDFRPKNELYRQPFNNTFALIKESNVAKYLTKMGYQTINYSLFDVGSTQQFYSMWESGEKKGDFEELFEVTLWRVIQQKISFFIKPNLFVDIKYPNLKILDTVGKTSIFKPEKPLFVYTHVMMPHFPFCFDENGKQVRIDSHLPLQSLYLAQLRYTNTLALKAIKEIIKQEKNKKPIIILQGDHGYRYLENVDLTQKRREAHSIFNAYLVPDAMKTQLNDTIRPIEGFQRLF